MNLTRNLRPYFLSILLFLFYFSEGIAKYFYFLNLERIKLPRMIKYIVVLLFFSFFLYKKQFNQLAKVFILFILFIVGQFALFGIEIPLKNLLIISKYIFPILVLDFSFLYFKNTTNQPFFKSFEILIIVNSLLIIFGYFFNIKVLNTYYGSRFGFDGLFLTSAGASYFYVIATYYLYLKFKKTYYYFSLIFFTLISVFLTGTKMLYLFIMFLLFFHLIIKNNIFLFKKILLLGIVFLVFVSIFFILEPSFIEFIKEKGMLTFIVSYRDRLLIDNVIPYIRGNWKTINYLFGGISKSSLRSQLGFVDLFFTFGVIGSVYYLVLFFKSLIKDKISLNTKFIIITLCILIFLGGNFFFNATIAIYLVILQQLLLTKTTTNSIK